MRSAAIFIFTAGFAAAQTATSTAATAGYSCAAQNIVAACLGSTQPQLEACKPQDWDCMCAHAQDVLTCYNNCPGHPDQFGAQQTEISYCNAAAAYGSSALAKATAASTAPAATGNVAATTTPVVQQAAVSTGTHSGATAAPSTGAANGFGVKLPVIVGGGLLAALVL